jgi:hypothetical protein
MFEPVQRAFAGQRRTVRPAGLELAGQDRHCRVVSQPVMVEHILVAKGEAEHPLADQRRNPVLDPLLRAPIAEATGEPFDEPDRLVGRPKQQRAGIRGHRPAVERRHHTTTFDHSKVELRRATLCRHRGAPLLGAKSVWQKSYRRFRAPMHLPS